MPRLLLGIDEENKQMVCGLVDTIGSLVVLFAMCLL